MSTPTGEITKIQLKTKVSPVEGADGKQLSEISLTRGEPLVNTNDKTLIIGGKDNTSDSTADASSNIVLGASKNEIATVNKIGDDTVTNTVALVHKDGGLARSTHYISTKNAELSYNNGILEIDADYDLTTVADNTCAKISLKDALDVEHSAVTITGSGATKVTSDGNGNITVNSEQTLTATQKAGADSNASEIKLSGDTTDDIVTILGGESTKVTTAYNVITISDNASYEHSSTTADTSTSNLEYITEVTQSNGQISAKKKTLQGTDENISITTDKDGNTTVKDIAEVKDDAYKGTDSKYVAKVIQTDGKIEYTKHTIVQGDNISVETSGGKTTISNTAALNDTAVDNEYVSEVDQSKGQISVTRRTILQDAEYETANNSSTTTSNGDVEVITSAVKPAGDKGIIPKKRKLKGAKGIEVIVDKGTSDITVQHTTTVKGSDGKVDVDGKASTTQTSNDTEITNGGTFTISDVNYDAQGHVTSENTATLTLPQYKNGTGINVESDSTTDVTNDYKVNLQTATTDVIGGIKISKDTTEYSVSGTLSPNITKNVSSNANYRAVEIDNDDKAFVYISTADKTTPGIAKLHDSTDCTSFTSDSGGGVTPAAVKKAANHDTKLYVGDSTESVANTATNNPYIKIAENKYNFDSKAVVDAVTNKIQMVGGTGVLISSDTAGKITVSNSAAVNETTNNISDSKDYIVSISGSNGSITPTKKVLTGGSGITITTGTGENDSDKAELTIDVTPGTGIHIPITGDDEDKVTLKSATDTEIGGIKVGKVNSDYEVYTTSSNLSEDIVFDPIWPTLQDAYHNYFSVETDKNNKAFVYIPKASYNDLGLVRAARTHSKTVYPVTSEQLKKEEYISDESNRGVEVDDCARAFVHIPTASCAHTGTIKVGKVHENYLCGLRMSPTDVTDEDSLDCSAVEINELGQAFIYNPIASAAAPGVIYLGHVPSSATERPVLVDTYGCAYVNIPSIPLPDTIKNKYTTKSVGGVTANTQIQATTVEELLKTILGITSSPSGFSFTLDSVTADLKATSATTTARWRINSHGDNTGAYTLTIGGKTSTSGTPINAGTALQGTISGVPIRFTAGANTSENVTGVASYTEGSLRISARATVNNKCYYGANVTTTANRTSVSGWTLGPIKADNAKLFVKYPSSWGELSKIEHVNEAGLPQADLTSSFLKKEQTETLNNGSYYVYELNVAVTGDYYLKLT